MSSLSTQDGTLSWLMASSSASHRCAQVFTSSVQSKMFSPGVDVSREPSTMPAWSHGSFGATWCTFFANVKDVRGVWSQKYWARKIIRRHAVLPRIARSAVHGTHVGHVYDALSSRSTACSSDLEIPSPLPAPQHRNNPNPTNAHNGNLTTHNEEREREREKKKTAALLNQTCMQDALDFPKVASLAWRWNGVSQTVSVARISCD